MLQTSFFEIYLENAAQMAACIICLQLLEAECYVFW